MIKYIFCINPGRSGSHYLAKLFSKAENCVAQHEPKPIMNSYAMIDFLNHDTKAMEALMPQKMTSIQALKGEEAVYMEANHCFIKGFAWFLPQYIPQEEIGVIILKRNPDKVVNSYFSIDCTPFNNCGAGWLMKHNAKNVQSYFPAQFSKIGYFFKSQFLRIQNYFNVRPKLLKRLSLGTIQKLGYPFFLKKIVKKSLEWYVEETYRQAEHYQKKFPNIHYQEVNIEDLNEEKAVKKLFAGFGLEAQKSLGEVLNRPTNLKVKEKK